MQIDRGKSDTRNAEALAAEIYGLQGPCVGCTDCVGLCEALIETLVLPDVVLSRKRNDR